MSSIDDSLNFKIGGNCAFFESIMDNVVRDKFYILYTDSWIPISVTFVH